MTNDVKVDTILSNDEFKLLKKILIHYHEIDAGFDDNDEGCMEISDQNKLKVRQLMMKLNM